MSYGIMYFGVSTGQQVFTLVNCDSHSGFFGVCYGAAQAILQYITMSLAKVRLNRWLSGHHYRVTVMDVDT